MLPFVRTLLGTCALLILLAPHSLAADGVRGVVRDQSGAPLKDADVVLATPGRAVVGSARTDAQGRFEIAAPAPGVFLVVISAPGFRESRHSVTVGDPAAALDVTLRLAVIEQDVTVTADTGLVQDVRTAGQPVNVIDAREIAERVDTVVAQAVAEEPGVNLQRTSPTMAGIFVRGLTGNKVNVFVDGIRYSTGAQRGGVNTFLDLVEPGMLESVEILRGPSSAQYGSDALGGSVQFLTRMPSIVPQGTDPRWNGSLSLSAGTGHLNGGGDGIFGYAGSNVGLTLALAGRKVGRIRPGGGFDSHAAVTRFLGLRSDRLMDERLPNTEFHQAGGSMRVHWALAPQTRIVGSYARTQQDGGERYDQLLGGDGNLISELNDLSLDFGSLRFERLAAGAIDYASFSYSINGQREERVNQGGNGSSTATIGHEPERTTVHGLQGKVSKQVNSRTSFTAGGDIYFEKLTSEAFNVNPVTQAVSPRRPRVPDQATFRQGGAFLQTTFDVVPDRIRVLGAFRHGGVSYRARSADSPLVSGAPLWPDDALTDWSPTFRAALIATPDAAWTFTGSVSRGFRAPHMTDLGTLGLTGSGFEVAAPDVAALGGFVGTTADANAVSSGRTVAQVGAETSLQYEGSIAYRQRGWRADFTAFVNTIDGNIQKQALILPAGAVGRTLGGQPITSQNANGAVFVALSTTPVLVRANFDRARVWGLEHNGQFTVAEPLTLQTVFTYLRARDLETRLPPNIEGGTPAPEAYVLLRWQRPGSKWWVEPYLHVAAEQSHLSTLDLGDRRTGAGRTRNSIQAFFRNGARNRGWISAGPDGAFGNADDVLIGTGETLAQVQDRVLGAGVNSSSLFTAVPGYAVTGVRFGLRAGRHQLVVHGENLTDKNYRGISWGVDAPGRGISARYSLTF